MTFADLLDLDFDEGSLRVDTRAIEAALPNTPAAVREVYSDHARKGDFQAQYAAIDIGETLWEQTLLPASEIIQCSIHNSFVNWTNNVAGWSTLFSESGWQCIDARPNVVDHWSKFQTWIDPPILLVGSLVGRPNGLHLMEGHTRVGTLRGLVLRGVLQPDSQHCIWRGTSSAVGSQGKRGV
jgi:hypothetical protein